MTRAEYETEQFVDQATERFHGRTNRWLTKDEATQLIKAGRKSVLTPPRAYWSKEHAKKRVYERFATTEIIRRIWESPESDPIKTIYRLYSLFDDIIAKSDSVHTWLFSGAMMDAIHEVLDLLK